MPEGPDMKRNYAEWLLAFTALVATCLGLGEAAQRERNTTAPADPRLDMVAALQAMSPHSSLGDQANVFGRFVGTWDVEYTDFSKDGKESHRAGELIVGWIMDGLAIQDLWIVYPSAGRENREVYTDVRYFDPKSRTWSAAFIDPEHASVARFTGGPIGDDRIELDTQDFGHKETRWSFNDIRPDTFVFRDEESVDDGKSWRLQSEYHMKRRGTAAPSHWLPLS
jgi:hypothetical protein